MLGVWHWPSLCVWEKTVSEGKVFGFLCEVTRHSLPVFVWRQGRVALGSLCASSFPQIKRSYTVLVVNVFHSLQCWWKDGCLCCSVYNCMLTDGCQNCVLQLSLNCWGLYHCIQSLWPFGCCCLESVFWLVFSQGYCQSSRKPTCIHGFFNTTCVQSESLIRGSSADFTE